MTTENSDSIRLMGEATGVPAEWLEPRWSIAEAAQRTGVTVDTLRYYERAGAIRLVERTPSGMRRYSEIDLERITCVRWLRDAGVAIEAIVTFEDMRDHGRQTLGGRRALLAAHRDSLLERRAELDRSIDAVQEKIDKYDRLMEHG